MTFIKLDTISYEISSSLIDKTEKLTFKFLLKFDFSEASVFKWEFQFIFKKNFSCLKRYKIILFLNFRMAETIFRNEPEYPVHIVPQSWQVFNSKYKIDRGLFFLDGKEWQIMRTKLNSIFLKNTGIQMAQKFAQKVTDHYIQG